MFPAEQKKSQKQKTVRKRQMPGQTKLQMTAALPLSKGIKEAVSRYRLNNRLLSASAE